MIPPVEPSSALEILKSVGPTTKDLESTAKAMHDAFPGNYPALLKFKDRSHVATDEEIMAFLTLPKINPKKKK